jgi:hypothetical protein
MTSRWSRPFLVSALLATCGTMSSFGCGVPDEPDGYEVLSAPLLESGKFLYLRCNATGWDPGAATRLLPTSTAGRFALTYNVSLPWLVSSPDSCIFTETNQLNGWGSVQTAYSRSPSGTLVVPGGGTLVTSGANFAVRYPALGTYTVTVNAADKSFTIASGTGSGGAGGSSGTGGAGGGGTGGAGAGGGGKGGAGAAGGGTGGASGAGAGGTGGTGPLRSRYLSNDAQAVAVARGQATVRLPSAGLVDDFGLQWRMTNALRMLGMEVPRLATGELIGAQRMLEIDTQLASREARITADAALLPQFSAISGPNFRDNIPQAFAAHLYARVLSVFNAGTTRYQTLSNDCLLANIIPSMCGVLVDLGTTTGATCQDSNVPLRAQQIVQSPDLFSFSNVRSAISATELPVDPSLQSTCGFYSVLVHEFVHDLDGQFGDFNHRQFDRRTVCSANLFDFLRPGTPFSFSGTPGTQNLAEFVSTYASGLPQPNQAYFSWEDGAETVTAYIMFPGFFRARAAQNARLQAKYDYVRTNLFGGVEFRNAPVDAINLPFSQSNTSQLCYLGLIPEFRADDIVAFRR